MFAKTSGMWWKRKNRLFLVIFQSEKNKDFLHKGFQSGVALGPTLGSPPGFATNVAVVKSGHDGNRNSGVWDLQGDHRPRSGLVRILRFTNPNFYAYDTISSVSFTKCIIYVSS